MCWRSWERASVIRILCDIFWKAMRVETGLEGIVGGQPVQSLAAENEEGRGGGKDGGRRAGSGIGTVGVG